MCLCFLILGIMDPNQPRRPRDLQGLLKFCIEARDAVLSYIYNYPNLESYPNPSENYLNPKFYHLLIGLEVLSFLLYIHN